MVDRCVEFFATALSNRTNRFLSFDHLLVLLLFDFVSDWIQHVAIAVGLALNKLVDDVQKQLLNM